MYPFLGAPIQSADPVLGPVVGPSLGSYWAQLGARRREKNEIPQHSENNYAMLIF